MPPRRRQPQPANENGRPSNVDALAPIIAMQQRLLITGLDPNQQGALSGISASAFDTALYANRMQATESSRRRVLDFDAKIEHRNFDRMVQAINRARDIARFR